MLANKYQTGVSRAAKWTKSTGVKPSSQNVDGARRAYPGKGALQALGLRRGTVRTIEKITGTMKLVAQAQLMGANRRAKETAGFFLNVKTILDKIPAAAEGEAPGKTLSLLVSSNRGLCGSLNSQLIRDYLKLPEAAAQSPIIVFGDKGATALEKRAGTNVLVLASAHPGKTASFADFSRVGELVSEVEADRILFFYNKLISNHAFELTQMVLPTAKSLTAKAGELSYDFEEGQDELFANFAEFTVAAAMHYTYYQSAAAETLSRRNAMDGANKNCKELRSKLSIVYNKLRQALITTDLIEITTGTTAVEEMS